MFLLGSKFCHRSYTLNGYQSTYMLAVLLKINTHTHTHTQHTQHTHTPAHNTNSPHCGQHSPGGIAVSGGITVSAPEAHLGGRHSTVYTQQ